MTITEFLLARITEDEASRARRIKREYQDRVSVSFVDGERQVILDRREVDDPAVWIAVTEPVAPSARALAECEAKRRIVDERLNDPWDCGKAHPGMDVHHPDGHADEDPILRALSSVYADHPDYDEAWRP